MARSFNFHGFLTRFFHDAYRSVRRTYTCNTREGAQIFYSAYFATKELEDRWLYYSQNTIFCYLNELAESMAYVERTTCTTDGDEQYQIDCVITTILIASLRSKAGWHSKQKLERSMREIAVTHECVGLLEILKQ
jgi:hypothetical protein